MLRVTTASGNRRLRMYLDRQEAWNRKIVLGPLLGWFGLLLPDILIKIRDIELINVSKVSRIRKMILDYKGKHCSTVEETRVLKNGKLSLQASTCYMQNCNNFYSKVICPGSSPNRHIKFSSGQDNKGQWVQSERHVYNQKGQWAQSERPVSTIRKASEYNQKGRCTTRKAGIQSERPVSTIREALFTAGTVKSYRLPRHWTPKKASDPMFTGISLQNIAI